MRRFQECNNLEKLWRLRHYLYIPFKWLFYTVIAEFRVYHDDDDESNAEFVINGKYDVVEGKMLWRLLIGDAQCNMNWTYTMDEVMRNIKEFKDGK